MRMVCFWTCGVPGAVPVCLRRNDRAVRARAPQPGARFSGPIEITGKASGATITSRCPTMSHAHVYRRGVPEPEVRWFFGRLHEQVCRRSFAIAGGTISPMQGDSAKSRALHIAHRSERHSQLTLKIP